MELKDLNYRQFIFWLYLRSTKTPAVVP